MITLTAEQAQQIEEALESVHGLSGINMSNPLATIRAARAQEQAEQDLDTCPGCGGVADNGHDREFPPNPYYCTKCIEQAEQEPVAFVNWNAATGERTVSFFCESELASEPLYAHTVQQLEQRPLGTAGALIDKWFLSKSGISENALIYAAPVRTKDLTDDEIDLIDALNWEKDNKVWGIREFARAVIAADREKNK